MVNPREATSFPGRIMNEIVGVVLKNDAACDTVPGKFRCIIPQRDCARKWGAICRADSRGGGAVLPPTAFLTGSQICGRMRKKL
jgi:hypothetical protein